MVANKDDEAFKVFRKWVAESMDLMQINNGVVVMLPSTAEKVGLKEGTYKIGERTYTVEFRNIND